MSSQRVKLISLGCSKNLVDSEHLLRQIAESGVEIVPAEAPYSADHALDVVVINTCGFIADAKEESVNTILEAVEAKRLGMVSKILVFGCLSQRYREELIKEIPEADGFFGAFESREVLRAMGIPFKKSLCQQRYLTTPKHYAYLKISEGCNRHCAYCAIPGMRGKHISVPVEELVEEAKNLAAEGVKELMIIAQDITYYGLDLYGKRSLGRLLKELCKVEGIEWIRLHYSYPASFPKDVIAIMASEPKICKYMDIPLQHSSTKVLKAMKRGVDAKRTQELIDAFRKALPGITLRTTMMVGFPGEDAREFAKLMEFVRRNRFDRLGAFTYSEEEGTYAAEHYKDSVRAATKERRYAALMQLQSSISLENNSRRIGTQERVIVDSCSVGEGVWIARSRSESPEVDGIIKVAIPKGFSKPAQLVGSFIEVKITGADEYDLEAEMIL